MRSWAVRLTCAALAASPAATRAAQDLKTYFPSGEPGRPGRYGIMPHWQLDINPQEIRTTAKYRGIVIFWLRGDDRIVQNEYGEYGLLTTTTEIEVEKPSDDDIETLIESLRRLQAQFSR